MTYSADPFVGKSGETHDLSGYLDGPPEVKTSIRNVYREVESGGHTKTVTKINTLVFMCL